MALLSTDPVTFKLDADGDMIIPWEWVRGVEAVAQAIRYRLRLFKGEWFLDRSVGMPWLKNDLVPQSQAILGRRYNPTQTRNEVRSIILGTSGVLSIETLELDFVASTRELTITGRVKTQFGDTVIEVSP